MKISKLFFLILLIFTCHAKSLYAATTIGIMAVSATVINTCTLATNPLNFPSFSGTQVTATADLLVTCTQGDDYTVGLSGGTSNNVTARTMTLGGNTLGYQLLQSDNSNWGNTPGTDTPPTITGTGNAQTITVHGKIPTSALTMPAGTYNDSITVTVYF